MSTKDLFAGHPNLDSNLLPYDGIVNDCGILFPRPEADALYAKLLHDTPWRHDEAIIYGKHIITARQIAWFGNAAYSYTYSGITRTALLWSDTLLHIKAAVEAVIAPICPVIFNSCLLNLYADGNQGMAWHSDDERELGRNPAIASVSLGATRRFVFKHKHSSEKREILLQHGQLIIMHGETQNHWLHSIPKSAKVHSPRISLTFRTIRPAGKTHSR